VTIARIKEGSARALQRPEVRAKLDAWNQSRIGSKLSDDVKVGLGAGQAGAVCETAAGCYAVFFVAVSCLLRHLADQSASYLP